MSFIDEYYLGLNRDDKERYKPSAEEVAAQEELEQYIESCGCFAQTEGFDPVKDKLFDHIYRNKYASHKQGFAYGFKYAMLLMLDVWKLE